MGPRSILNLALVTLASSCFACSEDAKPSPVNAAGTSVGANVSVQGGATAGSTAAPSAVAGSSSSGGGGSRAGTPPGANSGTAGASGAATSASNAAAGANPASGTPGGTSGSAGSPIMGNGTDYSMADHWLCRPDKQNDACATDLSTTVVAADGTLTVEPFTADPNAPIDCFYVYPTISRDMTPNSDLMAGPEERGVAGAQFARFASQCRLFAPVYRQVTLTALTSGLGGSASGSSMMPDMMIGYRDIETAWQYYLDHDNNGRGVVVIGHSQGSGVLTRLLAEHLDTDPVDPRFIAALLIGTRIQIPADAQVGGTFKHLPLCTSNEQTGCIVTYASFRSTVPPPMGSPFAGNSGTAERGGCTNPAALGGGSAELHSYLQARGGGLGSAAAGPWVTPEKPITTPWVSVPGLLSGECVTNEHGTYFEITVHPDPADPRTDDISGDIMMGGQVAASWGLHLIDMNLGMGNLLDLVHAKGAAHVGKPGP